MDIEAIEKDAVILTRYQIYLTQAHDGILLTLYGDDSAGNAREIATVVMHPNGAEEIVLNRNSDTGSAGCAAPCLAQSDGDRATATSSLCVPARHPYRGYGFPRGTSTRLRSEFLG